MSPYAEDALSESALERSAARYWNSERTVAQFAGLAPRDYLLDWLNTVEGPGRTALDLGCGAGRNTRALADRGLTVVAVDLHANMLRATRRLCRPAGGARSGPVSVVRAAGHRLPLRDAAFDLVVSYGLLHNKTSRNRYGRCLDEIARVVRPGGHLALNCFTAGVAHPSLRATGEPDLYVVASGTAMVLLPPEQVLRELADRQLHPLGDPHVYTQHLDVGPRRVLRCELVRERR